MSRRSGGPAISLFAFQDIITSVSGILILITLLLALELLDRVSGGTNDPASKVASEIRQVIEQARTRRDQLRRRIDESARSLIEALSLSPSELHARREDLLADADTIVRQIDSLRDRAADVRVRQDRAEALRHASEEDGTLDGLIEQVRSLEEEIAGERREGRLYYSLSGGVGRDGWLIDLSGARIAVAPLGRAARVRTFDGPSPAQEDQPDPAADAFLAWARAEIPDAYLLIVVRPSALRRLERINKTLRGQRRSFGYDLIAEEQAVLDDERGAAPP